jgi:hypothetical protein
MRVGGAGRSPAGTITNLRPSGETSANKPRSYGPLKSSAGFENAMGEPIRTPTTITSSPCRQKSSRPSRPHTARLPPSVETCHMPPGPGNGWTKTSSWPGSLD